MDENEKQLLLSQAKELFEYYWEMDFVLLSAADADVQKLCEACFKRGFLKGIEANRSRQWDMTS
jgi:hypothetical protein